MMNQNSGRMVDVNGIQSDQDVDSDKGPITIDEALQRTPLTSVNPFYPEVIPLPSPVPATLCPTSLNSQDRAAGHAQLQELDKEVEQSNLGQTSVQLEQTLKDLHFLLKSGDITKYEFQSPAPPPRLNAPAPPQPTSSNTNVQNLHHGSKLGSLASTLVDRGIFASSFRFPTPQSRKTSLAQRPPSSSSPHGAQSTFSPHPNQLAHLQNAKVPMANIGLTPSRSPHSVPSSSPSIMVKPPQPKDGSSFLSGFQTDKALLSHLKPASKKHVEQSEAANEILRDADVDQKERAQTALQNLQQLLIVVFEAEDSLELDSSFPPSTQQYFEPGPNSNGFILTDSTMSKLDSAIMKAINMDQIFRAPVEHLSRLQKMCARSIASAIDEDYAIPEDLSDDSLQQWKTTLEVAQNTMAASRLLLRIMTAGRKEKELYSEEALGHLLTNLKQAVEGFVLPVAESRKSSETGQSILRDKSLLASLGTMVQRIGRVLKLLGDLLIRSELSEMAITQIDFVCTTLVFVANASSEKESIFGVQKFELLRGGAMDTLARVFFRSPSQRSSILDEILSSLEKLPIARQNARHYSVIDGKPIQLVSALIMQLIQITATMLSGKHRSSQKREEISDSDNSEDESSSEPSPSKRKSYTHPVPNGVNAKVSLGTHKADQLAALSKPLLASVQKNASYVAQYLIARALKSSKTSEEPYRNLLDIFTEDFISVVGHTDWPAAELILQYLLRQLIGIVDNDKSNAPAKNMALDLMGVMGSGIADTKCHLERLASSLSAEDEEDGERLTRLTKACLDGHVSEPEILSINGPHRLVTDFLSYRGSDDIQLQNARSYHLLQWSQKLCMCGNGPTTPVNEDRELFDLDSSLDGPAEWLITAIRDPSDAIHDLRPVSTLVARTANLLVVLHSTFCKAMMKIFSTLLQSMSSVHATIRSRGLKSVVQLLEKDPSMLDRNANIVRHIIRAATDHSTMVRDAALGLIGRCVNLRPSIELQFLDTELDLTSDSTVGIRKRSIRLLKEVYLRNKEDATRTSIASAFLRRMNDEEPSVVELARQTLEEIWIEPYPAVSFDKVPLPLQQELERHAAQLIHIAEQNEDVLHAFEPFFRSLLVPSHKNAVTNQGVCRAIASAAFDSFIENDQQKSLDARANILALLSVLVRAYSTLLSVDQLKMLEAYTKTLKTGADLRLYKPVTQIYNAAMPCFLSTEREFLVQLQDNMVRSLSLIPPTSPDLLDEVTRCLWAMNKILGNKDKLVNICQSISMRITQSMDGEPQRLIRCIKMAGYFGKAWNLDDAIQNFKRRFTWWQGEHVADLIVELLLPATESKYGGNVRVAALESICLTCLSWPRNFLKREVTKALESGLRSQDPSLEIVVVTGLGNFFKLGEIQPKQFSQPNGVKSEEQASEKLGASMVSSDSDKAATLLAQHFFEHEDIQRIALRYINEVALAATELICSTNRQGLVHPRQSGLVLVALETSPNKSVAKAAYEEHLSLNSKHESILEKEYLKAIEQAFVYQRDTVKDTSGLDLDNHATPKLSLFFDVLKSSSIGTRKKLLPNLCKRLDINISKLDELQGLDNHYLLAKFVCQNLAFASYGRVDEIMIVCSCLESMFSTTGNALSQHIEPLMTNLPSNEISSERLCQLTLSSMLLSLFWRTRCHLRAVTSNVPSVSDKQDKKIIKDTSKAPVKSTNAPKLEEAYLKATDIVGALINEQAMRDQWQTFMDLLSIDHEAKITNESDFEDGAEKRPTTPDGDDVSLGPVSMPPSGAYQKPGLKRRRSESNSAASTPSSRKRGRPWLEKRKSSTLNRRFDDVEKGWD